jgi:regulator of sigma E protease
MHILIQAGQLLLALTILVFVHEMGHFLAARMFGIRVKKFYLFFDFLFPIPTILNFAIFKFKKGDTEYGLGWFPLGGYVQIAGMVDERDDPEEKDRAPLPSDYSQKPIWQRFVVMIGGIVMNIVFGILFYILYLGCFEKDYLSAAEFNKFGIATSAVAKNCGLQDGDKIVAINGVKPDRVEDILSYKLLLGGKVTVERNGVDTTIKMPGDLFKRIEKGTPFISTRKEKVIMDTVFTNNIGYLVGFRDKDTIVAVQGIPVDNFMQFKTLLMARYTDARFTVRSLWHPEQPLPFNYKDSTVAITICRAGVQQTFTTKLDSNGFIGFARDISRESFYAQTSYSLASSIKFGIRDAFGTIVMQVMGLAKLFQGQIAARESFGGILAIGGMFTPVWDWGHFWHMTAMISMVLAFMNFLPIPALDGGHMVMLGIEAILRRPLSKKTQELVQTIGTVLLLGLMVFANGNDILKKFGI